MIWLNLGWLVLLSCVAEAVSVARCTPRDSPMLRTTHGDLSGACQFVQVGDARNDLSGNVYSWLGIPYAEAPINRNRFKPPVELKSWSGTRNATKLPNACVPESPELPQLQVNQSRHAQQFAGFSMWRSSARQPLVFSEDCLYLNAYLPASAYLKVPIHHGDYRPPIMVFFHGGNTVHGSSSLDVYDPRAFVAATETIVVTINYRLGVFGFLSLDGGEFEGNQAILDQHAALRWVKNNAEALGGDPTKITIVGQDAGAVLAGYHLFYKSSWPLFRNMIMQSGTPLMTALQPISKHEANRRARELLKYIGCINQTTETTTKLAAASMADLAECARTSVHIGEAAKNYYNHLLSTKRKSQVYLQTFFPPVVDGQVITQQPSELLKAGEFKRCPLLLGFTADEGSSVIAQSGLMGAKTSEFKKQQIINHATLSSFIREYFGFYPNYPRESNKLFVNSILHEYTKIINAEDASLASTSHLIKPNYFHTLSKIIGDEAYVCPAYRLADFYSKEKQNVYLYLYAHRVSSTPWPSWYGAVHGDELAMTLGLPLSSKHHNANAGPLTSTSTNPWSNPKHVYSNSERVLSWEIMNYWAEFARQDMPKSSLANAKAWPEFRQTDGGDLWGQYMILKTNGTKIGRGFSIDQCQFWNSHMPNLIEHQDATEQSQSRLLFAAQQDQACSADTTTKSLVSLLLAATIAIVQNELLRF